MKISLTKGEYVVLRKVLSHNFKMMRKQIMPPNTIRQIEDEGFVATYHCINLILNKLARAK